MLWNQLDLDLIYIGDSDDFMKLFTKYTIYFVNVQMFLHAYVVFSVFACMDNGVYIIFIMWNSISGLNTWYHFLFNIGCGEAVKGKVIKKNSGNLLRQGG